jgi:hypothetical protein
LSALKVANPEARAGWSDPGGLVIFRLVMHREALIYSANMNSESAQSVLIEQSVD